MPPSKPKFRIRAELEELERTPRGKYVCNLCGSAGWGGYWWDLHRAKIHVQCSCGQVVLANGLKRHQRVKGCSRA